MNHVTCFFFEKSDSDNGFQQSKILIIHLVYSHLPEPGFERLRHCVKYNGTRLIDENYLNVLPCEYVKWNYMGPFLPKTIWFDTSGNIGNIYRSNAQISPKKWGIKNHNLNLRIKISIDIVYVFWAVVHNNFSFEWFRIWSIQSFMITESRVSVFLLVAFLFFFFEIPNIKFYFWSLKN